MFVASAPYRVSLLGGGSDYPEHFNKFDGATFGLAISDRLFISSTKISPSFSGHNYKFTYREIDSVDYLDDVRHLPFREVSKAYTLEPGWEMNVSSNLPGYTGLGSSSSFLAALVSSLQKIGGKELSQKELVLRIFDIERNVFNQKVGLQDQVFAVHGGCNLIQFSAGNSYKLISLSESKAKRLAEGVILVSTGTRRSASNYVKEISEGAKQHHYDMSALAQLAQEGFKIANSEELNLKHLGELIDENWKLKQSLSPNTSNSHIDLLIDKCKSSGALGVKLLGAGGGGFIAAIVEPDLQTHFMDKTQLPSDSFHLIKPDMFGTQITEV